MFLAFEFCKSQRPSRRVEVALKPCLYKKR